MRKESLNQRARNGYRRVTLEFPVTIDDIIRVEDLAAELGISRDQLLEWSLTETVVRWELKANRAQRINAEKALRAAADREPIGPLLDRFRAQMKANGGFEHKDSVQGLTSIAGSDMNENMDTDRTLRERREALGLSREKLARIADISAAAIEQFEQGRRPENSKALPQLEATLRQQERIAA